jgi:hypothetical protein
MKPRCKVIKYGAENRDSTHRVSGYYKSATFCSRRHKFCLWTLLKSLLHISSLRGAKFIHLSQAPTACRFHTAFNPDWQNVTQGRDSAQSLMQCDECYSCQSGSLIWTHRNWFQNLNSWENINLLFFQKSNVVYSDSGKHQGIECCL